MRRSDLVVVAVFFTLSVAIVAYVWHLPWAVRLYPLVLGVGMLVVSLAFLLLLLYRRFRQKKAYAKDLHDIFAGFRARQFSLVLVSSLLFVLFYYILGLYIAAFLYLFLLLRLLQQTWKRSLLRSALFLGCLYIILQFVLQFPTFGGVLWK